MPAPNRAVRYVSLGVALIAIGYLGVLAGRALRERRAPQVVEAPPFPLKPGDPFPSVGLADSTGAVVTSTDIVAGHVVLFLDPECEGCRDMSARWQRAIADAVVDSSAVVGVSRGSAEAIARYRREHALSYPIYRDGADALVREHGVTSYPLEVVVGLSGAIQSVSDDSVSPIDGASIRLLLAR